MRNRTSSQLARELGVSAGTIRYHARKHGLPFDTTPGGHRRYDIDEVRAVLAAEPGSVDLDDGHFGSDPLAFSETYAEVRLNESSALLLSATAGYDESTLTREDERLPVDPMEFFAVPHVARYPTSAHGVGAGAGA
jgi:hypothetical protein